MTKKDKRQFFISEELKLLEEAEKFLAVPTEQQKIEFKASNPWRIINFKDKPDSYARLDITGVRIGSYFIPWDCYIESWILRERLPYPYWTSEEVLTIRVKNFITKEYPPYHATCLREDQKDNSYLLNFRIPRLNFPSPTFVVMSQVIHKAYDIRKKK